MSNTVTVAELIASLQKNYEDTETVAYTIYSVADILDHESLKDKTEEEKVEVWDTLAYSVGDYIEQLQADISDYLEDEVERQA